MGLNNQSLRLRQGSDFEELNHYAALSHSWGPKEERLKPIPKTTKANIKDRLRGIPWDELTQTFQDGVTIARRLGFQAIWIDSLCIIQDDKEDWAVEASRMAINYTDAAVVFAASRSRTGDQGCFSAREPSRKVTRAGLDGRSTSVIVKRPIEHLPFLLISLNFAHLPLFERAWVFQERTLASRIVHYTQQEVVWECKECLRCECQGMQGSIMRDYQKITNTGLFKHGQAMVLMENDVHQRYKQWLDIVQVYAASSLAFDSDRLPALSAVAGQMHLPEMGRYMAGIWENNMPRALLWYSSRWAVPRRPSGYRAPTWSWVSVEAHIGSWLGNDEEAVKDVCHVLEVATTLDGPDSYGQVRHGRLRLLAPTLAAALQHDRYPQRQFDEPRNSAEHKLVFDLDNYSVIYTHDVPPTHGDGHGLDGSPVRFALVVEFDHTGNEKRRRALWRTENRIERGYLGLVLIPVEKQDCGQDEHPDTLYQRLGRVQIDADMIANDVCDSMRELTIVRVKVRRNRGLRTQNDKVY